MYPLSMDYGELDVMIVLIKPKNYKIMGIHEYYGRKYTKLSMNVYYGTSIRLYMLRIIKWKCIKIHI